jgi:hypothetical protein
MKGVWNSGDRVPDTFFAGSLTACKCSNSADISSLATALAMGNATALEQGSDAARH